MAEETKQGIKRLDSTAITYHPCKVGVNNFLDHILSSHVADVRLRDAPLHHVLP